MILPLNFPVSREFQPEKSSHATACTAIQSSVFSLFLWLRQKPGFRGPIGEVSLHLNSLRSVPSPRRPKLAAFFSQTYREVHFAKQAEPHVRVDHAPPASLGISLRSSNSIESSNSRAKVLDQGVEIMVKPHPNMSDK